MPYRTMTAAIACLAVALAASAQQPQGGAATQTPPAAAAPQAPKSAPSAQEPLSRGESKTVTVTVESIDYSARSAVLKTSDGRLFPVQASSDMTRFDKLKVGDTITATYYESIVLAMAPVGQGPVKPTDETSVVPTTGVKPGGTVSRQVRVAATIESVDTATSSVTVRGDGGRVVSLRVADPKVFERLKKGDRYDITYTEALLLSVAP
jgi:hypothetical protein